MKYIPDDIVLHILSKLPLKSLTRFGCVCKSWSLLFENSYLMDKIRHNFISNHYSSYKDTSLLFLIPQPVEHRSSFLFSLSGERFQNKVKLEWPNPFQDDELAFCVMGFASVNGILCLYDNCFTRTVLWNPATGDSKIIPPSPIEFGVPNNNLSIHIFGFGYDCVRDDYKVIRHVGVYLENDGYKLIKSLLYHFFEIYSLRSNSWRILDDFNRLTFFDGSYYDRLYLDGMCHVLCLGYRVSEAYVMSFDLSNEVFFTTLCPSYGPSQMYNALVMLNGSIALISNYEDILYISILVEPGAKESWTKLFVLQYLSSCIDCPIGVGKIGDIFFLTKYDEIVQLDLSTHTLHMVIEDLGIKGCIFDGQIEIYKKNSLPIRGISL